MRKRICAWANPLLKFFKLTLRKQKDFDLLQRKNATLAKLYNSRLSEDRTRAREPVAGLVFSKDRAIQLHALLASYFEKVSPAVPVTVLYHCSGTDHQQAYEQVEALFAGNHVSFVRQAGARTFRNDLLNLLKNVPAEKIFFLVDDILFVEDVDLNDFTSLDTDTFVPSLRLGRNLTRCYTVQQDQPLPVFSKVTVNDRQMVQWRWGQGVLDWGYPLSVDGNIFSLDEIRIISAAIDFSAPNTFEDGLQLFKEIFINRFGVCYQKSPLINVPCNKVQVENKNIAGEMHQDFLVSQWHKGMQINYRKLYGYRNTSAHEEILLELVPRVSAD